MRLVVLALIACGEPSGSPGPTGTTPSVGTTPTHDTGASPTVPDDSGEPPAPELLDCTEHCAQNQTAAGAARCYSCRCKNAMDGWLPSPAELQCSLGEEMVILTADADGALSPITGPVSTCANPSLLYGSCDPGGRLGQLVHGDVTAKWICRRLSFHADWNDTTIPYDDVGVILYNARNGASCWYDDTDGTGLAGDNWPDIDLTAPDADPSDHLRYFYQTEGQSCVGCHDNDPFNLTPHLQSVTWQTGTYVFGGFGRVNLEGGVSSTGARHLVSPEVAACTACHRISSTETCDSWALDAMGVDKGAGYQQVVNNAAGDAADPLWHLGTWMPFGIPIGTAAEWEAEYGVARDAIVQCCQNPGVDGPGCTWEPVPSAVLP
jgi:hypothetical protein